MCRLLCVRSSNPFGIQSYLEQFAQISRNSPEDQSHGWGCAWLSRGKWVIYRSIAPVWEDATPLTAKTTCLVAHARSAYRNEGIILENNMPFFDGERVFIFNGELQGVRIRMDGRIGAEKVFNLIRRYDKGDLQAAIAAAYKTLEAKSRYVRAMNLMIADANGVCLGTAYNENPDYFQMHERLSGDQAIVSSVPFESTGDWTVIANRTVKRMH